MHYKITCVMKYAVMMEKIAGEDLFPPDLQGIKGNAIWRDGNMSGRSYL